MLVPNYVSTEDTLTTLDSISFDYESKYSIIEGVPRSCYIEVRLDVEVHVKRKEVKVQ